MKEDFKQSVVRFIETKQQTNTLQDEIDWHGSFIEAGYVDSLGIYELIAHLESDLGMELSIELLLENPPRSLHELCDFVCKSSQR